MATLSHILKEIEGMVTGPLSVDTVDGVRRVGLTDYRPRCCTTFYFTFCPFPRKRKQLTAIKKKRVDRSSKNVLIKSS